MAAPLSGYAPNRLCSEIADRGHLPVPIDAGLLRPEPADDPYPLEALDGLLHVLSTDFPLGLEVLARTAVPHLNPAAACLRSADKYLAYLALTHGGIPTPPTRNCHSDEDLEAAGRAYGWPMVVKQPDGAGGRQVALVEDVADLHRRLPELRRRGSRLLAQKYIPTSHGVDLRVVVVDGRAVACGRRIGRPGEFRSNLEQGGRGVPAVPTPEERSVAVRAAAAVGLDIAGVDLLAGSGGPLVVEVNSFPGLEAIESLTGINVAGAMTDVLLGRLGDPAVSPPGISGALV